MFLIYDINLSVFLFETEFSECFLRIISFIPDKSDYLRDITFGESDRATIGALVEVSNHFSLEEDRESEEIWNRERIRVSEKYPNLSIEMGTKLAHISHKSIQILAIFRIDTFKFIDDIESEMITKVSVIEIGWVDTIGYVSFLQSSQDLWFWKMKKWTEDVSIALGDTREAINFGSADEIEEEGFDGVIEMMTSEDILGSVLLSDLLEECISLGSSSLFNSFLTFSGDMLDVHSTEGGSEWTFFTKILHREFVSITLRSSEMMVEMGYDDVIPRMESEDFRDEEHAVWTPRTSDDECIIVGDIVFCKESF